ncbi:hypothetical protein R5R73_03770 [Salinicola sp. LHM]|uniref:hypothetical protein n=1 Tax=Salinicola sp. LHM TaxID=3065298 RepID=UPI002ACE1B46|nr:hypothetical protein [Salinicola sp. LHM]WQH33808.1 hypothetical protein R5R73_03770 [Salinicola sp. LHM]
MEYTLSLLLAVVIAYRDPTLKNPEAVAIEPVARHWLARSPPSPASQSSALSIESVSEGALSSPAFGRITCKSVCRGLRCRLFITLLISKTRNTYISDNSYADPTLRRLKEK